MNDQIEIDERWVDEILQIRNRSKQVTHATDLIAFYGSSSIRLWDQMARDLAPLNTINLGFGGSSYFYCKEYFEEVFEYITPSKVILYAGDNDLGSEVPQEEILNNVNQLIQKIIGKYGSIEIGIISVKPSPDRLYLKNEIESLNQALLEITQSFDQGFFIDIYQAMLDDQGNVQPSLYIEVQWLLKKNGYKRWRRVVGYRWN